MFGKKTKSKTPRTRKALIKSLTKDLAIESSGNGYIIVKELARGEGFKASLITACKEGSNATNCLDLALSAAEAAKLAAGQQALAAEAAAARKAHADATAKARAAGTQADEAKR